MDLVRGMESLNVVDMKDVGITARSASRTSDTPLVRLVTMDTVTTSPHPQAPPSLQVFVEEEESPQFSSTQSHRLSGEHHVGGQDLFLHLHGHSPMPESGPTRLSVCRLPRMSASPYLQPLSGACHSSLRNSNVPFDEDDCLET